jgi:uncharacterized protein YndB with AHSA1/START domain
MMQQQSTIAVQREITLNASPQAVFAAFTEPEQLLRWWGEDGVYRMTGLERDLRPGGAVRYTSTHADGHVFVALGTYSVVEPPRVLEYTWRYEGGFPIAQETLVRMELMPRDGGTHLRLIHAGFPDQASAEMHGANWERVLGFVRPYVENAR